MGGYSEAIRPGLSIKFQWGGILKPSDLDSLSNFKWGGILKPLDLDSLSNFIGGEGGILYGFSICVTSSIFLKYSALFHECLGYYIYLLLFPILFTLLLIFH